jgi:hypothetical protein
MLALAVAFALGDLLPQRMGDYRLEAAAGAKGVYARKWRREATLLLTRGERDFLRLDGIRSRHPP